MRLCGFILAAGLGTRLRGLFPSLPKPLVPLGDRPAISYAMDFLIKAGVSRVIVNIHHMKDRMRETLPKILPPGMDLLISEEETILGTGGGLLHARGWFSPEAFDGLIVVNSDILTDFSPDRLLSLVKRDMPDVHLILSGVGPESERNRIGLFPGGEIWFPGMDSGGRRVRHGFFLGIHFIRPEVLVPFQEGGPVSVIDLYRRLILEGRRVQGSFTRKFWVDLGTEDGYRHGLRHLSGRSKESFPGVG